MAANFPGPFEVRINYSTAASSVVYLHQHRFSLDMAEVGEPGDPFSAFLPQGRLVAFTETLADYVDDYAALMQPFFRTDADIVNAELWEYEPGSHNAAFRSIYDLALNGTSASSTTVDGQMIVTFRSTLGGTKKMDFRQTVFPQAVFQLFPTGQTVVNDYATFCTGNNTPLLAWDNGYLFSAYKFLPGLNEHATRKRLR